MSLPHFPSLSLDHSIYRNKGEMSHDWACEQQLILEWKLEYETLLNGHIHELTDYLARTRGVSRGDILIYMKAWEIRFRKLLFPEEKKKEPREE